MNMKNVLNGLKCAAWVVLTTGLALGGWAAEPVEYLEPVYKTAGVPASGIDHWETKSVSDYSVVASSESAVTWGESGKTNWYVATDANVGISNGIVCKGFVNLILCKGAKLTVEGASGCAGIQTDDNGAFVIYGTPQGEGELSATGGYNGAGIGGSDNVDACIGSHITINGGKVTAQTAGYKAAGIGSGMNSHPGYDITINGGTVIAQSQNGGAGIGGSVQGEGHDITINAGRVLACSGKSAAIGGGRGPSQDDYCYENAAGHNITINGGSVCVSGQGDVIGSRVTNHPAHDNRIAAGANVLFCLDAGLEEPIELTESMVLVGSAGSLEGLNYTLAGGLVGFGIETLTMTNATTHETQTVTVGGEALVPFSGKKAAVRVSDGFAKLFVGQPIEATPTAVGHAKITGVYTNGVLSSESSPWTVWTYEPAFVVYEAESGLVFQNGLTVMTNMLDTTVSPAVSTQPLPSILQDTPVAKLYDAEGAAKGFYDSLAKAIAGAQKGETVVLLTNLQESVTFTGAFAVTLDLAGWTLTSSGSAPIIKVAAEGAALTIRDTSAAKTGSITTGGKTYSGDGAGIYVVEKSSLSMYGVVITNCVASGNGGAIYGEKNARILLKDCTVKGNVAGESGGGIYKHGGDNGNNYDPSDKLVLLSTEITGNSANTSGGGVYFARTDRGTCFAAGTMIRLADGSEKAIENIREGDVVATFDHEGGTNSTARVYYACKGEGKATPFTLEFDTPLSTSTSSLHLSIVGCHDLLEQSSRKYVTITGANVGQYIGAKFYGADGAWHTLTNVTMGTEALDYYSIYSAQHQNVYANGLLTVADDVDYLLNVYELDENLKADAAQLAADLAQYGEMSYEEAATYGVSREWYVDGGVKYLNVAIGKQLVSKAYAEQLFASTGRAASPLAAVQRPASTILAPLSSVLRPLSSTLSAGPVMAAAAESEPSLTNFAVNVMTLGGSTVVTNNTANGKVNNVYLDKDTNNGNSYIELVGEDGTRAGMSVGVTLAWGSGQFTTDTAKPGDVAYFWDDTGTYAVWYEYGDNGQILKLADGSQIVPPAVANTTYEIWKDGEIIASNECATVKKDSGVKVVYTADDGYVFDGSGATNKEVVVNTSNTVATMTAPAAPFEPAASVTTNGVTTVYGTLAGAWADACAIQKTGMDATVTMLKDAAVESTFTTDSNGALTLDLNDHVLAYVGQDDNSIIQQSGGTLHVVDTATTHTPHYFACDETGLWTLTNEVTELTVMGGLLTGARNSAIYYFSGTHSISNVNFVGNSSTFNGGAVTTFTAELNLAITDCVFLGNVAANNGGAVSSGICTMTDCWVEANVATNYAGGVYVRNHATLVRTKVVNNTAGTGGGVYLTNDAGGCFPAGVKILMADGTEKNVEDIVKGDVVATFDHVGGTNSSAAVFYVYGGTGSPNTFKLTFASGATLDIADRHDLLLEATRKYVTVSSDNARTFIGKRFYNYTKGCWDELVGVTAAKHCDAHYSIYVRGHANCVANGMLTVPDDKDCFINVYELDENLKADAEQLAADIATYGLATPADYPNIPEDDFEDGNVRYARIAIGKGLTTQAEILYWNEFDYGPIVTKKQEPSAPKLMMSAAPMMLTDSPSALPSVPYLQVGEGAVVTGNVTTAGAASNVYLDRVNNAVICVAPDATGLDVGVTLSNVRGVFTDASAADHLSGFSSDNSKYTVCRGSDGRLWIATDLQVGGDAWAYLADGTCEIFGVGDVWNIDGWPSGVNPLAAYRKAIANVVVESGVTSVGQAMLYKFYAVTNVTIAAGVTNIADHAFYNCHSLQGITFLGDTPALGEQAIKFTTAIRMDGDTPVVYTIPEVTSPKRKLMGKKDLADAAWTEITDLPAKSDYRFFKVVVE